MRKLLVTLAIVALGLLQSGYAAGARGNGSGSVKAAADSATAQRKEYEKQIRAQLKGLDKKVSKLRKEALQQGAEARTEINRDIETLNEKSANARAKLRQLENSNQRQQAWDDLEKGVNAAMGDLETAYQRAAADLKKGGSK